MLGEGATTASPVQRMKFDEAAFDKPRNPKTKWLWLATIVVVAGLLIFAAI